MVYIMFMLCIYVFLYLSLFLSPIIIVVVALCGTDDDRQCAVSSFVLCTYRLRRGMELHSATKAM
jgi:hypothetical protein